MLVAPLAGVFSERLGSRPFMFAGLSLQAGALAWLASEIGAQLSYILSSVRTGQAGQASGANNAIREVGGVLGVAVLASVFTGAGGYAPPQSFVNGPLPAMWVGVVVLGAGALVVLMLSFRVRPIAEAEAASEPAETAIAAGERKGAAAVVDGTA